MKNYGTTNEYYKCLTLWYNSTANFTAYDPNEDKGRLFESKGKEFFVFWLFVMFLLLFMFFMHLNFYLLFVIVLNCCSKDIK